jgi:hypothetical protein
MPRRRARERSLANPFPNPLTGGAKMGLALGVIGAGGIAAYALTRPSSSTVTPAGPLAAFPAASMVGGRTPLTQCPAQGTIVFLYDAMGNRYTGMVASACTATAPTGFWNQLASSISSGAGAGFVNVTVTQAGGTVLSTGTTYAAVSLSYLSST